MDFLKFLPVIFQLIAIIEPIRQALRNGQSVFDVLKEKGPTLIDFIAAIGKQMFPGITDPAAQVQAGALTIDPSTVMTIQTNLNKLGNTLTVDGAYGAKTKAAVTAFQRAHPPLAVDGWAGTMTQAAIAAEVAKLPA